MALPIYFHTTPDLGHDHAAHDAAVWLGLVAAAAMGGFFVLEKVRGQGILKY